MYSQLALAFVAEAFVGRLSTAALHKFALTIDLWVVRLDQAVFDLIRRIDQAYPHLAGVRCGVGNVIRALALSQRP